MALDPATFETLTPSRFIAFTFPHPSQPDSLLRVAVLDAPIQPADAPRVAAMFVPEHRESDWIFSTESGHLQLVLGSSGISRLILIGNWPINGHCSPIIYHRAINHDSNGLEVSLKPLLLALSPKSLFENGIPEIPILSYEDNVICRVVVERCVGSFAGEMLVEDVEIESGSDVGECVKREFRRRLRFKRMPNLVQTEIRLVPWAGTDSGRLGIGEVEFRPDIEVLVHPYLAPMVASISLISSCIEERNQNGFRPKALCVGVGGGALLAFLKTQLGFDVVGVEADAEVLRVARQYFGLDDTESIQLIVGDATNVMEKIAYNANGHNLGYLGVHEAENGSYLRDGNDLNNKFDIIMVDLDSSDANDGTISPPLEFVQNHALLAAKMLLCDFGILAINVIAPSRSFYEKLIDEFREVFHELYEIDVGNEENFVLVATKSPTISCISNCENSFLNRLRLVTLGAYMDSIRKI
ncbi:hypothetical protein I3842_14G031600 [Carya illinoinensis]|uniref:Methyltransferase-like protein 13 n=1 Tax=Carya illinoinensis TaxID=32201 RepID=A0A922AGZ3_CARIL|nr:hypothetical protein I3842_14G031600 [Carya illinoinensis]